MLPDPLSLISGLEGFELLLAPPLETDGQPQPDPQTLKNQISQIESATAKVKKVLEDSNLELRAEILKRFRYEKELQASETEFQKLRRQKMLAMDMVKRQNNEILELDRSIRELSAPPELPSSSRQASMCAAPSKPKTGRPRPASWKPASTMQCSVSSSGSGTVDATSSLALKSSVQTNSRFRSATPDASSIQLTDFEVQTGLSLRHLRKQYSSVLASKPKHIDAWKMYIP